MEGTENFVCNFPEVMRGKCFYFNFGLVCLHITAFSNFQDSLALTVSSSECTKSFHTPLSDSDGSSGYDKLWLQHIQA